MTGTRFLGTTLAHIDCQAQSIGAYGYGALADPNSTVSLALAGLLTIFIALFGIRLLLGAPMSGRDGVGAVVKIGIVLTLATSWPAWRVVGYDVVMNGPGDVAQTIGLAAGLPGHDRRGGNNAMIARLQNADDGMVAMTMFGTGRLTGGVTGGTDIGDSFHGVALGDETGFGWGRVLFLSGIIGPFAIVRLGAGVLLALAPLMAGFLLFGGSMGLFVGWLRGLAFCALGALAFGLIEGVELAILDPWLADVLAQRNANVFTPSAPTELMVLALAFGILAFGTLLLIARVAFQPHFAMHLARLGGLSRARDAIPYRDTVAAPLSGDRLIVNTPSRVVMIADAVTTAMRREEASSSRASLSASGAQNSAQRTPERLQRNDPLAATPEVRWCRFSGQGDKLSLT